MKEFIPEELVTLYGTMAISRISAARTAATLKAMPDIQEALKKGSKGKNTVAAKSLGRFDVETGGMGQEFQDFMTDGFENIIPGFGGWEKVPFPIPTIPDSVLRCVKILRALNTLREDRRVQQEAADKLEILVNALSKNAHPIVVLFAALFKMGLQEVQGRIQDLDDLINGLMRSAIEEDCL